MSGFTLWFEAKFNLMRFSVKLSSRPLNEGSYSLTAVGNGPHNYLMVVNEALFGC